MSRSTLALCTALALMAFAANSLLCRLALAGGGTDPAAFTILRLTAGAIVLAVLLGARRQVPWRAGTWRGGVALFAYAAGFSFAYVEVGAATGALLLFGAVQATMLVAGLLQGERLGGGHWGGFVLALAGLAALLLPGAAAPAPWPATMMLGAGLAWGLYSLWGRGSTDPVATTAGNFLRTLPLSLALLVVMADGLAVDALGALCAVASGALASGLGYVLWYRVLPELGALRAASLQLAVPPLTALGGVLLLGESLDLARAIGGVMVLLGIALVLRRRSRPLPTPPSGFTTRGT